MKPLFTTFVIALSIVSNSFTFSQNSSMEAWESLLNKKELADYFSGIFTKMGFVIEETKEEFTVIHHGDHFMTEKGIDRKHARVGADARLRQNARAPSGIGRSRKPTPDRSAW